MSTAIPVPLLAGPQFLGILFNWGLQTVLSVQVYWYYLFFPQDSIPLKTLVYGTLCFEWVQTGLITADAFDIYVYSYGDITAMVSIHNGWFSIPIMCGFIAAVVQIFFSWRIYKLARSRIVAGVIVLCSVGQFSVAVLSGVLMLRDVPSAVVASRVTLMLSAWLIASAIVDVLIAIVMTTFLIKVKTSLAPADDLVNRLIRLVIETGTLTATIAIIDVVLFYTTPTNSLVYECPLFILSKLYANTLLVNLNNRAFMRRGQMVIDTSVNNSVFGPRSNIDFRHPQDVESVPEPRCQCMAQVDVLRESDLSRVSPENPQRRTYGDSRALIGNDDLEDEKTDSAALVQ